MGKKIFTSLHSKFLFILTYGIVVVALYKMKAFLFIPIYKYILKD